MEGVRGVPGYLGIEGERRGISWHLITPLKQILLNVKGFRIFKIFSCEFCFPFLCLSLYIFLLRVRWIGLFYSFFID